MKQYFVVINLATSMPCQSIPEQRMKSWRPRPKSKRSRTNQLLLILQYTAKPIAESLKDSVALLHLVKISEEPQDLLMT